MTIIGDIYGRRGRPKSPGDETGCPRYSPRRPPSPFGQRLRAAWSIKQSSRPLKNLAKPTPQQRSWILISRLHEGRSRGFLFSFCRTHRPVHLGTPTYRQNRPRGPLGGGGVRGRTPVQTSCPLKPAPHTRVAHDRNTRRTDHPSRLRVLLEVPRIREKCANRQDDRGGHPERRADSFQGAASTILTQLSSIFNGSVPPTLLWGEGRPTNSVGT